MVGADARTNEQVYDEDVAPLLMKAALVCKERGMSLVVAVEYARDEIGQTTILQPGAGFWVRLVDFAARARGNVDILVMGLMRHAREHGHGSAYLSILGVPSVPGRPSRDLDACG